MLKINGTHQHQKDGKVYTYDAEYTDSAGSVTWSAKVRYGGQLMDELSGILTYGTASNAPTALRDHIISAIDLKDYAFKPKP
jgi:hypothetical protein